MATTHRHSHTPEGDAPTHGHLIRWAPSYDLVVTLLTLGRSRVMRQRTVDLAELRPGESVLEVGCGTGAVARAARTRLGPDGQVIGIDPSAEMIAVARRKAARHHVQIDFRVAGIEALPLPDASVDAALSSLMMHHLPADLKRTGLAEVRRVLKPGGRLVIVDFGKRRGLLSRLALSAIVHHSSEHSVEDLLPVLEDAGFGEFRTGELGIMSLGFVTARAAG
jgi:demethylmenaquinone methyltransferase/2-methoxy-6-polyprenyl-1,4-benzoquinol methylase/phosphoethanolamine N-methyltransferase